MKPTILFILHMPPPVHGAAMMGQYIHDSKVINEAFDCHYINLTLAKDINDIGKGGIRKLILYLKKQIQIAKAIRKIKPQLCYITPNTKGGPFYKDFVTLQLLKCLRQKIVVHFHNKGVRTRENRLPDKVLYRSFFQGIKVILLAPALYTDIQKFATKEQIVYCPNGIPSTSAIAPQSNNEKLHILFISNIMVAKGVWDLIKALEITKDKNLNFQCDFIGKWSDISEETFHQKVEEAGLTDVVQAHGAKYGEEKEVFLNKADVFVLPTHDECFPLTLLEAMEKGLPCIACEQGGIPDIVEEGETGFIVPSHSPEALAERIAFFIEHPEQCAAMGKAGKEKFLREFTLDRFENRMKEILEETLIPC